MSLFNPAPIIRQVQIRDRKPCIVVDDFVRDPDALVQYASNQLARFSTPTQNAFPGMELRMPDEFSTALNEFFVQHIRKLLDVRRSMSMYSRLSMITLQPDQLAPNQRVCHQDHLPDHPQLFYAACVLYLFKNKEIGGTSFFSPRTGQAESGTAPPTEQSSGYITTSTSEFELLGTIPAAWNRAIFYDGTIFHSGHVTDPSLLDPDPTRGRLTMNGFFTCKRAGG
jgi:hypothetical protein